MIGTSAGIVLAEPTTPAAGELRTWRLSSSAPVRLAPAVAGLLAWGESLHRLRLSSIGLSGLLAAVDPGFYIGFVLVIGGFLLELARADQRRWILIAYLVATAGIVHAVAPLLFHVPQYAWVYKHIGVTRTLQANGHVTDTMDIYQEWPALFAAAAGISTLSGVDPLAFAAWAPLAFEISYLLVLVALFRSLSKDPRTPYLAALLFEILTIWEVQDYLSPQAFSYLLWFGLLLIVLYAMSALPKLESGKGRLARLRRRLSEGVTMPPSAISTTRRVGIVSALVVYGVIVISHQLTPYMILASLVPLALLGLLRSRWVLVLFAVGAIGFALSRLQIVNQYGGFISDFNIFKNASGNVATWSSSQQAFDAIMVRSLCAAMWGLTALVILVRRRRLGSIVIPAVLAFAPFSVLFAQDYGGEAIYRVYLFSAPWCALLIAQAILELKTRVLRVALFTVTPFAFLIPSLQGQFGPLMVYSFTSSELSASLWLYAHTPAGSTAVLADSNFPVWEDVNYEQHPFAVLPAQPSAGTKQLDPNNLSQVDTWIQSQHLEKPYFVVSQSMSWYAKFYGYPSSINGLSSQLATSSSWQMVFHNASTTIYRYVS